MHKKAYFIQRNMKNNQFIPDFGQEWRDYKRRSIECNWEWYLRREPKGTGTINIH